MTEHEKRILEQFFDVNRIVSIEEYGDGHINRTFLVCSKYCRFIIQKINSFVFQDPIAIVRNIELVTEFIRNKLIYRGYNPENAVLTGIYTTQGKKVALIDGEYWRGYMFIEGALAHSVCEDANMFREVGKAVGDFQFLLEGFNPNLLKESIPHFHDTPYRYKHFIKVCQDDIMGRLNQVKEEVDFINSHRNVMNIITNLLDENKIPLRVTHNDTKLSNVMIHEKTKKALCLIDLDTVMKGSLLYDYGDALRCGASLAIEDEKDLNKVKISKDFFRAFSDGFLKKVKPIITDTEIKNLVNGFLIMTLEVGMRFLDDYLDGDKYFKIDYEDHNLVRARNQIKLVKEIELHRSEINEVLNEVLIKYEYDIRVE